ncbi:MAG: protein kinase, partial [Planctomycetes bacterium]|nr:protein kinase [Planctomycetota bacterium]
MPPPPADDDKDLDLTRKQPEREAPDAAADHGIPPTIQHVPPTLPSAEPEPPQQPSAAPGLAPTMRHTLAQGEQRSAAAEDDEDAARTVAQPRRAAGARPSAPTPSFSTPPQVTGDLTGQTLAGKYRILRLLGKGGFGAVYEALDELLEVKVAIKVLRPAAAARDDALEEFREEAKRLTTLDHPNVVRWISFDRTPDGTHYFVMELLDGEELSDILQREGRLAPARVIRILLQTLSALKVAHDLPGGGSLLHLDLKPRNVFVVKGEKEQIKVIDFGISQHVGAVARRSEGHDLVDPAGGLEGVDVTATIATMATPTPRPRAVASSGANTVQRARGGTLMYASPEQCRHLMGDRDIVELDGRSDLYSLGIMAFQMLTGQLPWPPLSARGVIKAQLEQEPPKLLSLGVKAPRGLVSFVERCLEKDREARFPDAKAAHDALYLVANPPSPWPKVAAAVAAIAALVVWLMWPERPPVALDVRADRDALFLGPATPSREVTLANLLPSLLEAPVRLVANMQSSDDLMPGWNKRIVAASAGDAELRLRIEAPTADVGPVDREVIVRVGDSSPVQYSQPLRLVFVGEQDWAIESVGVPGADGRAIDPRGSRLEVAVDVRDRELLSTVRAACQGATRDLIADPSRTGGDKVYYTLPLDSLGKFDDETFLPAEVTIDIADRASNRKTIATTLQLDARPLRVTAQLSGCIPSRPGWYTIAPQSRPVLTSTLNDNRRATIKVTAQDAGGKPIAVVQEQRGGDIALTFPTSDEPYAGILRVEADDSLYVLHDVRTRGHAAQDLQFEFQPQALELEVTPATPDHVELLASGPDLFFLRQDELSVEVRSSLDVPVDVVVTCVAASGQPASIPRQELDLRQRRSGRVAFSLPTDGTYRIEVSGYRYSGVGIDRSQTPERQREILIVRDTRPPQIDVEASAGALLRAPEATGPLLDLRLQDPATEGAPAAQLALHWHLRGPRD